MAGDDATVNGNGHGKTPPVPVWPDDQVGAPPLDGVLSALVGFEHIGDASPLDIEVRISTFLAELGAGAPYDDDGEEPSHEELVNGLVEVCLHHLESDPPRVLLDFLWVVDAFGLGYLHWPLHDRLRASAVPSSPAWAWAVGNAEITGTHLVTHELGDGFDVAITARHPGAERDHVVAVYIDANLDGMAKDLLVHDDADAFIQMSSDEPGMVVAAVAPAVAAATIDEAVDKTFAVGALAPVAEQFAALYSVVEHYVAKLAPGSAPIAVPAPATADDQAVLVDRFLAEPAGSGHTEDQELLLDALEFVVDELGGDPLRWTPVVVHLVAVGWLPLSLHGAEASSRFTEVLRAFIPWAHAAKGWGTRYVDDALSVLDLGSGSTDDGGGVGRVAVLEEAVAAGIDLDDEAALDAFLDEYLDE